MTRLAAIEFELLRLLDHQLTIRELEQEILAPHYPGEVAEVVWRSAAAQKLTVTPEGKICRKT